MSSGVQKDLFTSLVSDIKSYQGKDPLQPWLRGIKRMQECLPPHIVSEKLPRFLQKCAQTFQSDRRYRNDSRYLRVWIQLLDLVDDPRAVLRIMEMNQIGMKRTVFYSAYALYYEKRKKFDKAEKMYHLGVQNLAEPSGELHKAYEHFVHRMELYKKRRAKKQETEVNTAAKTAPLHEIIITGDDILTGFEESKDKIHHYSNAVGNKENIRISPSKVKYHKQEECMSAGNTSFVEEGCRNSRNYTIIRREKTDSNGLDDNVCVGNKISRNRNSKRCFEDMELNKKRPICEDDTVVVKFVDSAIDGKSEAEDACHHGLVDPTINMKDAMNAINNMFKEPLEIDHKVKRKSYQSRPKPNQQASSGFQVYVDDGLDEGDLHGNKKENGDLGVMKNNASMKLVATAKQKPSVETFKILADDDDDELHNQDDMETTHAIKASNLPVTNSNTSVFQRPNDLPSSCNSSDKFSSRDVRATAEDTVIRKFVVSTIFDEPEVENACHHGLVDPTVNMKEAMQDINSMFGKPINFGKTSKRKKTVNLLNPKLASHGFSIFCDEDLEVPKEQTSAIPSKKFDAECELFEPTMFTKEAMDEINEMFGKPLDF